VVACTQVGVRSDVRKEPQGSSFVQGLHVRPMCTLGCTYGQSGKRQWDGGGHSSVVRMCRSIPITLCCLTNARKRCILISAAGICNHGCHQ
jgi:hypothetical protein